MFYVAVDIGCIECGEPSNVIGIFTNKEQAKAICEEYKRRYDEHHSGQHEFEIFEVPKINEIINIEY